MSEDDATIRSVRAESKIDSHVTDCIAWRVVVQESFKEFRTDLKIQNRNITLIIGGLIAASKIMDLVVPALHR